jgi:hypothetical protein
MVKLKKLIFFLEVLDTKGIFRESGTYSKINEWIKKYEKMDQNYLDDVSRKILTFLVFFY